MNRGRIRGIGEMLTDGDRIKIHKNGRIFPVIDGKVNWNDRIVKTGSCFLTVTDHVIDNLGETIFCINGHGKEFAIDPSPEGIEIEKLNL